MNTFSSLLLWCFHDCHAVGSVANLVMPSEIAWSVVLGLFQGSQVPSETQMESCAIEKHMIRHEHDVEMICLSTNVRVAQSLKSASSSPIHFLHLSTPISDLPDSVPISSDLPDTDLPDSLTFCVVLLLQRSRQILQPAPTSRTQHAILEQTILVERLRLRCRRCRHDDVVVPNVLSILKLLYHSLLHHYPALASHHERASHHAIVAIL